MNYSSLKNMMFISMFLLATASLQSQSIVIKGTIVDSTSSQPVSFANVAIGFDRGTITDDLGNFRLPIKFEDINDSLHISCIGFTNNKIPIKHLSLYEQNIIYLEPNIYSLNSVTIKGKSKRIPRSRKIIHEAIAQIDTIFLTDSIVYEGYYREYIKKEDQYLNLFEGIINLEEFRYDSVSNFNAELTYKRINNDFNFDKALALGYDNENKFVPFTTVHMNSDYKNELLFLRLTDPLKNVYGRTISFIDNIRENFIYRHRFNSAKLTYLDERPYYYISFVDNQKFMYGTNKVDFQGGIFIDAENRGIKKITYLAKLDKGSIKQKLYELNVEYKLVDGKYILHYASFNNLFMIMDFILKEARSNNGRLELEFSRKIDSTKLSKENITIFYKGIQQNINNVDVDANKILLSFDKTDNLAADLQHLTKLFTINDSVQKQELEDRVITKLGIEFNNIYDEFQNPMSNKKYGDYYQYREFFVHKTKDIKLSTNLINNVIPVFENVVSESEEEIDTTWLNTPLISENTEFKLDLNENKLFNTYINRKTILDTEIQNEMVYLHVDRELYAPQDTIWFKAYIRNKAELISSDLSKSFFVKLVDPEGKIVWEDKFLIEDATVKGQLPVEAKLPQGIYYLNAYTSWMENFEPGNSFTKKILIQKEKRDKVQMMVAYDEDEYFPGDTMNLQITCVDGYNRKLDNARFRFKIVDGKKTIYSGNGVTLRGTDKTFQVVLPTKIDSLPKIEFFSNYDGNGYTNSYLMPVNYFLRVNFFPEGGYCINGLKSNIAFKAETRYGRSVNIEGDILNSRGEIVEHIKTEHDGMGLFSLKPESGDSCYLQLSSPAVFKEKYYLPAASENGMQLSITTKDDKITARVENFNTDNDTVLLTVTVRGKLHFYKAFNSGKTKTVRIPGENFPPGVAVITLFDNNLTPMAERLIFLKGNQELQAEILTDKESYSPRDSVILKVQLAGDADLGNRGDFSLSVVDNQLCMTDQVDEPGIVSYLLMSPEIKGKINNPNYYFDNKNEYASEHLDLLLLTQGWRNYRQLKNNVLEQKIKAPENRETISGYLMKHPFGKDKVPAPGSISVFFGGQSTHIQVEEDGRFSFLPHYEPEFNSGLSLYAKDEKEKPQISIVLDENPFDTEIKSYLELLADSTGKNAETTIFTYNRFKENFTFDLKSHEWIEEVVISKTIKEDPINTSDLVMNKRSLSKEEIETFTTIEDLVEYYSYYFNYSENVYFVIDGMLQATTEVEFSDEGGASFTRVPDYSWARGIQPEDIEEFTMVKGFDVTLYGLSNLGYEQYTRAEQNTIKDVVVDIKLKPFNERSSNRLWEYSANIKKFAVAKEFYTPVYDTEQKRYSQLPDLRKTIHWDNDVEFDENGVATIKFYNGDRYTRIKCILEGMDDSGIPVRAEYMYEVDL